MSVAEDGIVNEVVFRGDRMDLTITVQGIVFHAERTLEEEPIAVGEVVQVLVYRLYIFDEEKTYLVENSAMKSSDEFFI